MTFHKEGYTSLAITVLFIFVLNALIQFYFPEAHTLKWFIYILSFLLFVVIVQFFRSPSINISTDETTVLCPADGKVVVIEETEETEFLKDKRIQLSVFMSPVNVHVNRNPISGVVSYFKYHKGKYLVAWHPKSSTENERTTVVVKNSEGISVLFRQIAGALARRIVWYVKEGDAVEQGQQFGFIKFGSRVDVFLPLGSNVLVNIGDVVKGGRTILAELPSAAKTVTGAAKATAPAVILATPIDAPAADVVEPTVIKNAATQEELPLVIDHPKTEAPKKPAKKATTATKATKPTAAKTPKAKDK
ncbi:MAG: phosphatidylserine decarboxylase [Mucilaginibacter sp.]|nr:phosphatidylserine decarboxylase [Mucilaginibacter sp.]